MIKIVVTYTDGQHYECTDVERIMYREMVGDEVVVAGAEITTHHFPLKRTLWVHTADGVCSVSGENARAIDVFND